MTRPAPIPPMIGWPLLPELGEQGRLEYPTLDRSVRQSIRIVLSTRPGERLMRPEFGAGLSRMVGEPNTIENRRRIHDLVTRSLEKWEPRIILDRVEVLEVPAEPTWVQVEILYRLRRTGAAQRLGLTLEMGG